MTADFHVFLSHNTKDKPLVRKIAERLAAAGLRPWLDVDELRPGLPWQDGLEEAMRTTGAAAVFVGGHGVGSWQKPEIRVCLSQMVERGQPVIPVLLSGAPDKPQLNLFLRENTWVDLRQGLSEEGVNRLIWGITGKKPTDRQPGPVAPEPQYENERARQLAEALEAAQIRLEELTIVGGDTKLVRQEIGSLRRKIRKGGLQAGDILAGRFKLINPLGQGGFATVWQAYDRRRRELVAVKVLHRFHAEDRTRIDRFFRGARKMAELHHPGIARVLESRFDEGAYHFFMMEYVAGGDLEKAVFGGSLQPAEVLPLITAVGEALTYAHALEVVHRDVKPANILLDAGQPKLTDFDLVRVLDTATTDLTQTLQGMGTILYTAPEVLHDANKAQPSADVYSLAMTAVFAFSGEKLPRTVLRDADKVIARLPCSARVQEVLKKAVSWEPEDRQESIAQLCRELVWTGSSNLGNERINKKDRTIRGSVPSSPLSEGGGKDGAPSRLDMGKVGRSIASGLSSQLGLAEVEMSGPMEARHLKTGDTFDCEGKPQEGGRLTVKVIQKDDHGNIAWELTKLDGFLSLPKVENVIKANLKEQANVDATVTCGDKKLLAVKAGDTFECKAFTADGTLYSVKVTVKDNDGNITWAVKDKGGAGASTEQQ
ncbi:MAG TPA: protein kinase [Thermoanaerobaculia bacterium]|jgi:serine/threonine protein kinase|nr:protein kinase [Thermoanaerobaculia bacterium]